MRATACDGGTTWKTFTPMRPARRGACWRPPWTQCPPIPSRPETACCARSAAGTRAAAEPAPPSEAEKLIDALKALHPDEMSPREALDALYALKGKLKK